MRISPELGGRGKAEDFMRFQLLPVPVLGLSGGGVAVVNGK
jgi:hypothetical protein